MLNVELAMPRGASEGLITAAGLSSLARADRSNISHAVLKIDVIEHAVLNCCVQQAFWVDHN